MNTCISLAYASGYQKAQLQKAQASGSHGCLRFHSLALSSLYTWAKSLSSVSDYFGSANASSRFRAGKLNGLEK